MKSLRNALILCAACVSTQAHGTNFFVGVDPLTGQYTISIAAGETQTPPPPSVVNQRAQELAAMGYFSNADRETAITPQQLATLLESQLGTDISPTFQDIADTWAQNPDISDALANLVAIVNNLAADSAFASSDALLRAYLGLASAQTDVADDQNDEQTREQRDTQMRALLADQQDRQAEQALARAQAQAEAQARFETIQRERQEAAMARERAEQVVATERADRLNQALRQQSAAQERARAEGEAARQRVTQTERVADLVNRRPQDQPDPGNGQPEPELGFEDFPFYFENRPTDEERINDIVRSGIYRGISQGFDFNNQAIRGRVTLTVNANSEDALLSGNFDFGEENVVHVDGSYDNAIYLYLDDSKSSTFGGVSLNDFSDFMSEAHFFGPNAEEIGGDWSIKHHEGTASGEFAAARTTP